MSITSRTLLVAFFLCLFPLSLIAEVSITIYNQDLSMVREKRKISIPKGKDEIRFQDVPSRIIPSSVHFKCENVILMEQNYEYDLVDFNKLLLRYIDQCITVTTRDNRTFSGTLLSSGDGIVIANPKGEITSLRHDWVADVSFPQLPGGLITRPTLVWKVDSPKSGDFMTEVSYLTRGLSWQAEYIALVDERDEALNLSAWVNITNNSGGSFTDTKVKLIAGDVSIVPETMKRHAYLRDDFAIAIAAPQFEQQAFYEYHLYTLQRTTDIADNQIKQVSLFNPADAKKITKEYRYGPSLKPKIGHRPDKVNVTLIVENSVENGLGMAIPKGRIRVYKEGPDGTPEFIGEDSIDHTPTNEMIYIATGSAFDIVGEKKQTYSRGNDRKWEISIRNRKQETIEIYVSESLPGGYTMVDATSGWKQITANIIEWKLNLKPNEEKVVFYHYIHPTR